MPALQNRKHEAFAQAVANGSTGVQAYRSCISDECTTSSAIQAASRLLSDVNISSRVEALRNKANETLEKRLGWTKEKAMAYLVEALETPVGELDEKHRLANEVTRDEIMGGDAEDTATITRVKIKGMSKADAMKQLAAMCGWNEAEKQEHSGEIKITIVKQ